MTSLKTKNPVFMSGPLLLEHRDEWRQASTQSDIHIACDNQTRVTEQVSNRTQDLKHLDKTSRP